MPLSAASPRYSPPAWRDTRRLMGTTLLRWARPQKADQNEGRHRVRLLRLLAVLLAGLGSPPAVAASPVLVVAAGGGTRQFTAGALLAWHAPATLPNPPAPPAAGPSPTVP